MAKKKSATGDLSALAEKIKRRLPHIEEMMKVFDPIGEARTLVNEMGVTDSGDSEEDRDIAERMLAVYQGQPLKNNMRELGDCFFRAIQAGDFNALRRMSVRLKRIVECTKQNIDTQVQKLLDLKHEFIKSHRRLPLWTELKTRALEKFPISFESYREDSRQWSRWRKLPGLNRLRSGKPGRPPKKDDK